VLYALAVFGKKKRLDMCADIKRGLIITIDGPAGAGKSTVGRHLAQRLSYIYLDTGALYRAVAFKVLQEGISPESEDDISELCGKIKVHLENRQGGLRVFVDEQDVTENLRTEQIGLLASRVSAISVVRKFLLPVQQGMGAKGRIVAEGRDMGTVVFPDADVKFFLDAGLGERIRRRYEELARAGKKGDYPKVERDLIKRDSQDRERSVAPLKIPDNAVIIDSTNISVSEVVEKMMSVIMDYDRFCVRR